MDEYKTYLAASILSDERVVTYRLLSRELKVHVNTAKQMLFDFHRLQNAKKPGTIYATYLVSGIKREAEEPSVATNGSIKKDGEDEYMQSSPFMPSSLPQIEASTGEISVLSISLTGEDKIDSLRSQYETITSIHIYSIGPQPIKDLQILSDITREVQEKVAGDDPLKLNATYGTIINKQVERREGRLRPAPIAAAISAAKPQLAKSKTEEPKEPAKSTSAAKQEPKSQMSSAAKDFFSKSSTTTTKKETVPAAEKKLPALKKETSSLMKSFAKAKPKLKREGTDTSANTSAVPSAAEDSPMGGMSADEDDDDDEEPFVPVSKKPASSELVDKDRKSRKDREAALKRMMEEEEEEELAAPASQDVEEEPIPKEKTPVEEPPPAVVSGGRRRGRRRVMKKKTIKDEEGYLVTKEEPVWESFSEEEPVAPKPNPQASTSAPSKTKKPAAKGQGSIMSFFGKK